MSSRNVETLNASVVGYLERCAVGDVGHRSWDVQRSSLAGFGVFARRPLNPGDIVFVDRPVIIGPRAGVATSAFCVQCAIADNLQPCPNGCGLPLCSQCSDNSQGIHLKECKIIRQWQTEPCNDISMELLRALTPIRSLLLSDDDRALVKYLKAHRGSQQGFEVDILKKNLKLSVKEDEEEFMRFVCAVLDSNAFEVLIGNKINQTTLRGLYPLASLANHCCVPNTMHVFDEENRMIVRAAVPIARNEEIFHSYTRLVWGTLARRFHLYRTKNFFCHCPRCRDSTEFGTYISAVWCKKCRGKLVPWEPLQLKTRWKCEDCGNDVGADEIASITSILGSTLKTLGNNDWQLMLKVLDKNIVPESNQAILELKLKFIWNFGYSPGLTWSELPPDLLEKKKSFCSDILTIIDKLGAGRCKMRGLLLYELYCCLKEMGKRKNNKQIREMKENALEMDIIFKEVIEILRYDISAPDDIKKYYTETK